MARTSTPRFERIGMAISAVLMAAVFGWVWSHTNLLAASLVSPFLILFMVPLIGVASAGLTLVIECALWLIAAIRRQRARAA